jgi:hypothetical protein
MNPQKREEQHSQLQAIESLAQSLDQGLIGHIDPTSAFSGHTIRQQLACDSRFGRAIPKVGPENPYCFYFFERFQVSLVRELKLIDACAKILKYDIEHMMDAEAAIMDLREDSDDGNSSLEGRWQQIQREIAILNNKRVMLVGKTEVLWNDEMTETAGWFSNVSRTGKLRNTWVSMCIGSKFARRLVQTSMSHTARTFGRISPMPKSFSLVNQKIYPPMLP